MFLKGRATACHRLAFAFALYFAVLSRVKAQDSDVRINFGSTKDWTDSSGNTWKLDTFSIGKPSSILCTGDTISGTTVDEIYCRNRFFTQANSNYGPYILNVPVARAGQYLVRLHFAELHFTAPDARRFDVYLQKSLLVKNLDLVATKGYKAAFSIEHSILVTDQVSVELVSVKQNPLISAIEVLFQSVPPPTDPVVPMASPSAPPVAPLPTPAAPVSPVAPSPTAVAPVIPPTAFVTPSVSYDVRYNFGSLEDWTDPTGNIWKKDTLSIGARKSVLCSSDPISGTVLDTLYCTNRWFSSTNAGVAPYLISFPLAKAGTYRVRLHFAETAFTAAGRRVFDVWVQGSLVASGVDLVALVGSNAAYILEVTVPDTAAIEIKLQPFKENPLISAVEILEQSILVPAPVPVSAPQVAVPVPIPQPVLVPAPAPVTAPTQVSVPVPQPAVLPVPAPMPVPTPTVFQDTLINCGGSQYLEKAGTRTWLSDQYFTGGRTATRGTQAISNTEDDKIYQSERSGNFNYSIPVPPGDYEIKLHFAEIYFNATKKRVFTMLVEGQLFDNIDLFEVGGFATAFIIQVAKVVDDGSVDIQMIPQINNPKLSGIEIVLKSVHTAHAVSQGPYTVVDKDGSGNETITVDASASHTHGPGLVLTQWIWKKGAAVLGTGEITQLTLPIGVHNIVLTVVDSANHAGTEATTITVLPKGYPDVESISPGRGSVSGGYEVTIMGSGFSSTQASQLIVHFGLTPLTGADVHIVDDSTIKVVAPYQIVAVPVQINVESLTLNATSNSRPFTYETATPIAWTEKLIAGIALPTTAAFSPNGKLYVGTSGGQLAKISLDADYNVVDGVVKLIDPNRSIHGMAFDPMTTADEPDPWVYFSACDLFHGGSQSSSGSAINGKIMRARGASLDIVEDVVTGLPVADMDHAINDIEFGNNGELYFQLGSNTNGGIPGPLTGNQIQKENYFSAGTNVAYLADANFNGNIQYDKPDDGVPTTIGVEPFAYGERNPFGICMHSNGYLYGTDNGSNLGYGPMKTGCAANQFIPDFETEDKINLLLPGHYYGHPNPLRAASMVNETRQCKWRNPTEPSDADFKAPLVIAPSSTGAIIEFRSDHFGGQMRGHLIYSKYTSQLFRVILRPDGQSVIPQSIPPLPLVGKKGLGVTQAPDGCLVQVQYSVNELWVFIPNETSTSEVRINSVWPHRGPVAGGSVLTIYGKNLQEAGATTSVTVGTSPCPVISITANKVQCTLPGGSGMVDVTVIVGTATYSFVNGYRFITGYR